MMESKFEYLILSIVAEIPMGCVASYSQVAKLAGYPKNARKVGKILSMANYYGDFPCHRVVHSDGKLVDGWREQELLLKTEGVLLDNRKKVNMKQYQWQEGANK